MTEDDADQYISRDDFPGNGKRFFSTFDYILWIAAVDSRDMLDNPLNHDPSLSDLLAITKVEEITKKQCHVPCFCFCTKF